MFVMVASISASVGCGFFARSAAAAMIWPDWQYPHCGTSSSIHARCTGCERFLERPSIVVTRFPATAATGSTQVRVATPSRWTVQAPHCAMPQPNLVPVRPRLSRSTQGRGVSGVTFTVSRLPLTVKLMGGMKGRPRRKMKTTCTGGHAEGRGATLSEHAGRGHLLRRERIGHRHHVRPPTRSVLRHDGRHRRHYRRGHLSHAVDGRVPCRIPPVHSEPLGGRRAGGASRGVLFRRAGRAAAQGGGRVRVPARRLGSAPCFPVWLGASLSDCDRRDRGGRGDVRELCPRAGGAFSRPHRAGGGGRDRPPHGRELRRRQAGGGHTKCLHGAQARRLGCPDHSRTVFLVLFLLI